MRSKRGKIIFFGLLLVAMPVVVATWYGGDETPTVVAETKPVVRVLPQNPYVEKLLNAYDDVIRELMHDTGIPGAAVAIIRDTTVIFQQGYGVKSIGGSDSVNHRTVFRIGSVSKCFAAMLTAILVEENVVHWDDPVVKYLPDFQLKSPEYTRQLTIRHLLSHTTGLPYHTYTTLVEDGMELKEMIARLKDVNDGPVGELYSYQNVAFSVIGEVIHAATGKTYEQMLEEKIFRPLTMREASATYEGILYHPNVAHPHLRRHRQWKEIAISDKYYNVAPAGGINASIQDMTQWMQAMLGNKPHVISRASLDTLYKPFVRAASRNRAYRKIGRIKNNYYGLGWRILQFPNDTLIYHGGYVNGYRSEVAIYPKDRIAICILANAPGDVTDTGIPLFMDLYLERRDSIQWWDRQLEIPLAFHHAPMRP
ncbi:MAG TPA: serine hydrolase domain-containing protein [Cyclobacteriaceae bacterium]